MREKSTTPLMQTLRERGLSTKELADAIDLNVRTIHNVSCGASSSRLARRRIQRFLGLQLWDDIPLTQELIFTFEPDVSLEFSHLTAARSWARQFNKVRPGVALQRGRTVRYRRRITVSIELEPVGQTKPGVTPVTRSSDTIRFNQKCRIEINPPPKVVLPGREIEFPSVKDARDSIADLPAGTAKRRGRVVTLTVPATFSGTDEVHERSTKTRNRKISASSSE